MEKLNRLVWAAGISFTAFGVRIGVRASAENLLEPLASHLPVGWKPEIRSTVERLYSIIGGSIGPRPSVRRFSFLYGDVQQLARTTYVEDLYEALESDMDFYLAQATRQRVFVHAGVVAWKGRAIVIPGRSQSGKTTLVRAFLQAGASYYSDEYAVFDERGRVHPFPRHLSIRGDTDQTGTRISAESLGSQTGIGPLPVGLVTLTRYRAGGRWKPRALSPGRGTLGLLANALTARRQPERALATLGKVVHQVPILAGTRGEAVETVVSILHVLDNSTSTSFATSNPPLATRRNRE
jgi:hypothetical protein